VEHLGPLGARVDLDLDRVDLELAVFAVDGLDLLRRRRSDRPVVLDAIEDLLGVGGDLVVRRVG
jgi:hypothetical protein